MTRQKRASFEIEFHLLEGYGHACMQKYRYGLCSHYYSLSLCNQHILSCLLPPHSHPPNQPWQHNWESFSSYMIFSMTIAGNCDADAQGKPASLACCDLSMTLGVFRMKVFFERERRDKLIFEHFQTPLSPLRLPAGRTALGGGGGGVPRCG